MWRLNILYKVVRLNNLIERLCSSFVARNMAWECIG